MREDVHRERRHADVRLVAVRTRPCVPAVVQAPVRLLVTRQIRRRRVVPAALGARVPTPAAVAAAADAADASGAVARPSRTAAAATATGGVRPGRVAAASPSRPAVGRDERLVRVADRHAALEAAARRRTCLEARRRHHLYSPKICSVSLIRGVQTRYVSMYKLINLTLSLTWAWLRSTYKKA